MSLGWNVGNIAGVHFRMGRNDLAHPSVHMVEAPARLLAWDEEAFPAGGDMNHIESAFDYDQPQGAWLGDKGR